MSSDEPQKSDKRKLATANEHANRRQQILEAAVVEFGRKGFAGARVDRIAQRAHCNKQLIYYYFASKAGLYEQATQYMMQRSYESAYEENPGDLVYVTLHHIDRAYGGGLAWLRFWQWESLEHSPDGELVLEAERIRVWEDWVSHFRMAQQNGDLAPDIDADMLALAINSVTMMPLMLPQLTKMIVGENGFDAHFKERQETLLKYVFNALHEAAKMSVKGSPE